ncbi:hypothetical protein V6N11_078291 [Hibiscus sabdariffa]|uniref:Uncharacterized protein n=1 Tax=Hibiscus sabdariffa TaxID=183260 RepID=A0ABR2TFK7_9ROSI
MNLASDNTVGTSVQSPVGSQGNADPAPNSAEGVVQLPVVSTMVDNYEFEGVFPSADDVFVGLDSGGGGTSEARSSGQSDGGAGRENSSIGVPSEARSSGQEKGAATGPDSSVRVDQGSVSSSSEQPVIEESSVVRNDAALQSVDNNINTHPMQTRSKRGIFKPKVYSATLGSELSAQAVLRRGGSRENVEMFRRFRRGGSRENIGVVKGCWV